MLAQLGANRACLFTLDGRRRLTRNRYPRFVAILRRTRVVDTEAPNPQNYISHFDPMAAARDQVQPLAHTSHQTEQGGETPNCKAFQGGICHGLLRFRKRNRRGRRTEIPSQLMLELY